MKKLSPGTVEGGDDSIIELARSRACAAPSLFPNDSDGHKFAHAAAKWTASGRPPAEMQWKPLCTLNGSAKRRLASPSPPSPPPPPVTSFPTRPGNTALGGCKTRPPCRSWSSSGPIVCAAVLSFSLLLLVALSLVTLQLDPKGCRMSYMRPSFSKLRDFDTEHTRFASKYSLYLYREQGIDDERKLRGVPVLFIPGNAGSYKQVRPIAAETANYFLEILPQEQPISGSAMRTLDFFTVDFNEDITAFHGQTLLDQAEYLNEAVRYILSLYLDPRISSRDAHLPDPTSVIILGHSMGGIVARTMLVMPNYQSNSINTIVTMSAPHARPPVTFDGQISRIYEEINEYWRQAYAQKWANDNPLWHVTLVSIAGGSLDTVVPSDYARIESLVPDTHGFTVFTSTVPLVWTSMDHQAIIWCDQFRKVLARALYNVVDVRRPTQTKPRAERMRVFRQFFLTGLEDDAEKKLPSASPTTMITVDDSSHVILPPGSRLSLQSLGAHDQPRVYLLPITKHDTGARSQFSFLSNEPLISVSSLPAKESGKLDVLLCSVISTNSPASSTLELPFELDFAKDSELSAKLACKTTAQDVVQLPASTQSTMYPFVLDKESGLSPFSFLQYDMEDISEHDFVAVIDKTSTFTNSFVLAEIAEKVETVLTVNTWDLISSGVQWTIPATRPLLTKAYIPALRSSLLSYRLNFTTHRCSGRQPKFAPLARQFLNRPYESKFYVNVNMAEISLHGVAPYVPPALSSNPDDDGLRFQFWADPNCESEITVSLAFDIPGSMGQLYMRYRTALAAFPLLVVSLVLCGQFRTYDRTGTFISFAGSLDSSLKGVIPVMLLALTALSVVFPIGGQSLLWISGTAAPLAVDFHQNDLLSGTHDPVLCFLIPLIGIMSVGACITLHYLAVGLTNAICAIHGLLLGFRKDTFGTGYSRARLPAFVPATPKRRIVTAAVLLLLVSTFIPYQFAYLVACLVQLLTTSRALRLRTVSNSSTNRNFYHYAHSILLLMLWVLPINLPILAVWIRNLAVHWMTPFSSHHNILSIMPFILLVENLTSGRMVPRVTNRLRDLIVVILFGTAVCAAIYGISHAYMLHYLVNIAAAWLVIVHLTSDSGLVRSLLRLAKQETSSNQKDILGSDENSPPSTPLDDGTPPSAMAFHGRAA